MKIGVFGDSFACRDCTHIWWQYLESDHGHQVISFGEGGSSLGFSVEKIDNHHGEFDRLIWCMTTVNRISIWHDDRAYHNTGTHKPAPTGDWLLDRKLNIIHQYLVEAFDPHFQEIMGHALVGFMLQKYPNLMIVPSFATPVYFMQEHKFNLYHLCQKETQCLWPHQDPHSMINGPQDGREGHLTKTNQRILASLINSQLGCPIFTADYNDFSFDPQVLAAEFGH